MSDLDRIARELVEGCRNGTAAENLDRLYAENAESVEAAAPPGGDSRVARGLQAIKGKHQWWDANHEVHATEVLGPYPHGDDRFGVIFRVDATHKESGQNFKMEEIAIYTVENGKIVREEFFYQS